MNTHTPLIEIQNVSFTYNGTPVLETVNLTIREGDFVAMVGPNGGGKTTLLKLILGLMKPDAGSIKVMGEIARKASHHIGYVPQNVNINRSFPITVLDLVLMGKLMPGRRFYRISAGDRQDALDALARMEMAEYASRKIATLSGGQRQRVFIARALVARPKILLLDEPTASIDTKGQTEFYKLLRELNQEVTILMVSHDILVISSYVKSMACMNRKLHYHPHADLTEDVLESMFACSVEEVCPVGMVSRRSIPHQPKEKA